MKFTNHILLIIFISGINLSCFSQEFNLRIFAKDSLENVILNKIKYNKATLSKDLIQNELDSISKSVSLLGYLNAKIISIKKNDSIFLTEYKLNNQIKKIEINIELNELNNEFLKTNNLVIQNKKVKIPYKQLNTFISLISRFYEDKGFPFVKIRLINHKIKNNLLTTDLTIQKKKIRMIDRFIIKGYKDFPNKYIKFSLNKLKNKKFSKTILTEITAQINSIPFITQIKKPEALFLKDSTLIYIYLQKKKASQFDGLIGFSTNDKSKLVFNGYLNLKLNNLFNKGELIEVLWKSNQSKDKYLDLSLELPYIFNSRINPKINFSIYNQDSSYVNIQSIATLNYIINNRHKIGLITSHENSNNLLKEKILNILDYKTNLYGVAYNYKVNSNNIFYKNKQLVNFIAKHGLKKTIDNKINKTEILLSLSYLININKKIIIKLKNYSAVNISDEILKNELYQIGGINSIRGFLDKSIAASKYSIFTSDINYKINKKTYLYSIIDYSQTYNENYSSLISLGIGYKAKLKFSIFDINYSIGKTQRNSFNIKKALLNIRFINYF